MVTMRLMTVLMDVAQKSQKINDFFYFLRLEVQLVNASVTFQPVIPTFYFLKIFKCDWIQRMVHVMCNTTQRSFYCHLGI